MIYIAPDGKPENALVMHVVPPMLGHPQQIVLVWINNGSQQVERGVVHKEIERPQMCWCWPDELSYSAD